MSRSSLKYGALVLLPFLMADSFAPGAGCSGSADIPQCVPEDTVGFTASLVHAMPACGAAPTPLGGIEDGDEIGMYTRSDGRIGLDVAVHVTRRGRQVNAQLGLDRTDQPLLGGGSDSAVIGSEADCGGEVILAPGADTGVSDASLLAHDGQPANLTMTVESEGADPVLIVRSVILRHRGPLADCGR
jgi:hypothetical protein